MITYSTRWPSPSNSTRGPGPGLHWLGMFRRRRTAVGAGRSGSRHHREIDLWASAKPLHNILFHEYAGPAPPGGELRRRAAPYSDKPSLYDEEGFETAILKRHGFSVEDAPGLVRYVCGAVVDRAEDPAHRTIRTIPEGLPRTRGEDVAGDVRRGFPAHAGMDPAYLLPALTTGGLPRTRGDGPSGEPTGATRSSASPHTRGWTRLDQPYRSGRGASVRDRPGLGQRLRRRRAVPAPPTSNRRRRP